VKIEETLYVAGVKLVRTRTAFRRQDGTLVPFCKAVSNYAEPVRTVEVQHGSVQWVIQEFEDGSRRIIISNDYVPITVYPVHQSERLEDIRGIPAHVLRVAEQADISRVRSGALVDADRALLAEAGLAQRPAPPVAEVWASGRDVILHPEVAVYRDGSALRGRIVHERWQDAVDALDGFIKALPLHVDGEALAHAINQYAGARVSA